MIDSEKLIAWLKRERGEMLILHEAMGWESAYGAASMLGVVIAYVELEVTKNEP